MRARAYTASRVAATVARETAIAAATLGIGTAARGGSAAAQAAYKGILATQAATGGYQIGTGAWQLSDGDYEAGALNMVAGGLRVGGSVANARTFAPAISESAKNTPSPDYAQGSYTTFRTDPKTGKVTHYETRVPQTNPQNPNPWQIEKHFDGTGRGHFNKATQQNVPTPHVHDPSAPGGVRPPRPYEIPAGYP
jgi:hypothetical protein